MTIQKISNEPSFTAGKLIYVDSAGKKHKQIQKLFSPILEKEFNEIRQLIKNKKYNLYISLNKRDNSLYEFNANYNYSNVRDFDLYKKAITVTTNNPNMFKRVATIAMNDFERTEIYKHPSLYRKILNFFN